jgi:hypothetical protein
MAFGYPIGIMGQISTVSLWAILSMLVVKSTPTIRGATFECLFILYH